MSRASRVIVLAEDEMQQRLVRRYLYKLGYNRHDIYAESLPSGRGSGEQFVREHYAKSVRAYRERAIRAQTALVVAIDADNNEVSRRTDQLQQALVQDQLDPRRPNERIVLLLPKRNIESWILNLNGAAVDETADYSGHSMDGKLVTAANTLFEWSRPNFQLPDHAIPSLRAAIDELRRLG